MVPAPFLSVGLRADRAPAAVVPVPVVAVLGLRPVFATLGDVAWTTEQLALQCLLDQRGPSSRHVRSNGEDLGLGVDVIELQLVSRAASNAFSTELSTSAEN